MAALDLVAVVARDSARDIVEVDMVGWGWKVGIGEETNWFSFLSVRTKDIVIPSVP
jgi:hypothetical protein